MNRRIPTEADLTPGAPVPDEAPDWSRTDEGLAATISDNSPSDNPMGYKSASEMLKMSDADLATYIEQYTFDYDGTAQSVRVALVRLLRAAARPTLVELERAEARAKA